MINETRNDLNFRRTSGATDGRIKGALKSILPFAITVAISWPMALLAGIGALSYRWQKRWEDKDAKRHIINPAYWTDYLANRHGKSNDKNKDKDQDKNKENDNLKTAAVAGVGAGVGALGGGLLATRAKQAMEVTPEERKTEAFKIFWVTFSNGEIMRVRALDENGAKELCNTIIKQTTNPVYNKLNDKIRLGCPRYKLYLDTGEIVYWSGIDKKTAVKEAFSTRLELCTILNREYPNITKMEPMEAPTKVVKSEAKKGEYITIPELNNYTISTEKPDFSKPEKTQRRFYEWGTLKHFKTSFGLYSNICFPSESEKDAEKIIKEFYSVIKNENDKLISEINTSKYKVTFIDGDIYHIPEGDEYRAGETAKKIHNAKLVTISKNMTGVNKEDFDELLNNLTKTLKNNTIKDVKRIEKTPDNYKMKQMKQFKLIKYVDDNDNHRVEYGPFDLQ